MPEETLEGVIRSMRLPIPDEGLVRAARSVDGALRGLEDGDELAQSLRNDLDQWRFAENHPVSAALAASIRTAIAAGADGQEQLVELGRSYTDTHAALRSDFFLPFEAATAALGLARTMAYLAAEEQWSASRIAALLGAREQAASLHWQVVQRILRDMGLRQGLDSASVDRLWVEDCAAEPAFFGDAGLADAVAQVASLAEAVAYPGDLAGELGRMVPRADEIHGPHVQMLCFQCVIAAFSDHELHVLYEFSPRGVIAKHICVDLLGDLSDSAENPFLNNAKGVNQLDAGWAQARKSGERGSALALASILRNLSAVGFSSRKELARALRLFSLRLMRLRRETLSPLAPLGSTTEVQCLLDAVVSGPTNSLGIIEQRVVDVLALTIHDDEDWTPSGVGDAVNATNFSKRKLGDVEFLDAASRHIVAYEPHAGTVTPAYLEGHVRSLERVLSRRGPELLAIDSDANAWSVSIIFVAHAVDLGIRPLTRTIAGFRVNIEVIAFGTLRHNTGTDPTVTAVNTHVITPLNQRGVPDRVRRRILEILDSA